MADIQIVGEGLIDEEAVRQFLRESAMSYHENVGNPDLDAWPDKLARHATAFCVRRPDGSLAAALLAYLNDTVTHVGYIPFICVLPECEKGTAYRLHEAFRTEALRRGMTCLRLEVVKTNEHAYKFYRRQGYAVIEDRADRNRWLMELVIGVIS